MQKLTKQKRLETLRNLLGSEQISKQNEILAHFESHGIIINQGMISRDLNTLKVVKIRGFYRLPIVDFSPIKNIFSAGANMWIVKTQPAQAMRIAATIDNSVGEENIATLAGDDVVMVTTEKALSKAQLLAYLEGIS